MDIIAAMLRFGHLIAGIMWLGGQYYLDFIYSRARVAAGADGTVALLDGLVAARLGRYLRLSGFAACVLGLGVLSTISLPGHHSVREALLLQGVYAPIGIGAWIGAVMLAITIGPMRTDDVDKAMRWTRVNTALSLPLLFFMAFGYSYQGIVGL